MTLQLFHRFGIYASSTTGPQPVVRFDASTLSLSNGATVNSMTSGGYTAAVPAPATAPTFNSTGLNGNPSVQFDGTDMLVTTAFVPELGGSDYSFYTVVSIDAADTDDRLASVVASDASVTNGAWISRLYDNGALDDTVQYFLGDAGIRIDNTAISGNQKQFILSLRVDIDSGAKKDIMSLDAPLFRDTDLTQFQSASAPHYEYLVAPYIWLTSTDTNIPGSTATSTRQFGEFRAYNEYIDDVTHESIMQELFAKWT